MKIYDITRSVSESLAVWPDDRPFTPHWTARIAEGSSVNVGAFEMSTHAGTHVDAPLHFQSDGAPVDRIKLETLVGPAYVVHVEDADAVGVHHVERLDFSGVPRVLFRTQSSNAPDGVFDQRFIPIDPEIIRYLAERRVVLIGTDAPSVDPFESTVLTAHHELARCGMVNLENLMLREVPPGLYRLTALPLKLVGLDAAPIRAILTPTEAASPGASH